MSGLRFDIYERVQLPQNQPGIGELDEIELSPQISVSSQDTTTVLKGYLRLSGKYAEKAGGPVNQQLDYRIPVEISLPASRAGNAGEIGAEIENFDVDVISDRSLNVTGVLSLRGIALPQAGAGGWPAEDEEVAFVHHVAESAGQSADGPAAESQASPAEAADRSGDSGEKGARIGAALTDLTESEESAAGSRVAADEPQAAASESESEAGDESAPQEASSRQVAEVFGADEAEPAVEEAGEASEPSAGLNEEAQQEAVPPQEQGVKIAFIGKKEPEAASANQASSLSGALHRSANGASASDPGAADALQTSSDARSAQPAEEQGSDVPTGEPQSASSDALEWKKLFLSGEAKDSFRKMRMCIVQKEETMELIAERYGLNPREIQLYNRLGEQSVSEGQIIYIPVSN